MYIARFPLAYSPTHQPTNPLSRHLPHSIQRYRAKRARRVFKKKIRYQSRKTYAEARPRIRGRFARRDELVMLAAGGEEEEEGGGEMQHEDLSV